MPTRRNTRCAGHGLSSAIIELCAEATVKAVAPGIDAHVRHNGGGKGSHDSASGGEGERARAVSVALSIIILFLVLANAL